MTKLTLFNQTKDNKSICKIIIDDCSHSNQLGIDFKKIQSSLSNMFSDIKIIKSICEKPEQLSEIIHREKTNNIVVIGFGNKEHISKYKSVDLPNIPPSKIQIVDIRLLNAYQKNIDAFKFNVYLTTIQSTISSDIELKPIHKPFKLNKKVSRRNLFRVASTKLEEYTDIPIYQNSLCGSLINSCPHCIKSCPYGAVTKKDSNIIIIDESCVRCGACCVSCPTGALQLPDLTNHQMISILESIITYEEKINNPRLLFTCNQSNEVIAKWNVNLPQDVALIQIPCISVLGFTHTMLATSYGINVIALCPNNFCKQKDTLKFTHAETSIANSIIQEANPTFLELKIIEADKLENVKSLLNNIFEKPTGPQRTPSINKTSKRPLMLSMLSEIAPKIDTIFEQKITPFFDIVINSKLCTMCDACSNICSVDALKSIQVESSIELTFRSRKCVGCYACVKVCPEICIDIKRRFIPKNIVEDKKDVKNKDSISICKKCGEPIGYYKKIKNIEKILSPTKNTDLLNALYLCRKCKSTIQK